MAEKKRGRVIFVGAGPGDPGLITVKGLDCLKQADVVIHDRLLDKKLLEVVSLKAKKIDAGKSAHRHGMKQDAINRLMIQEARLGKRIVRLKGGDPFVFGRGGEEAEALTRENIPFEVIPGISSAISVPVYAGIPLTQRHVSSSFAVVTGHRATKGGGPEISWRHLSHGTDTLIFLMGVGNLVQTVDKLIEHGKPDSTPIAVVEKGAGPGQRTVVGTLGNILDKVERENVQPPAVIVIGDVVRLREKLRWFDVHPLFGKRVLVTRPKHQAPALSRVLLSYGALPFEAPTIEIHPPTETEELDRAIKKIKQYRWIIFTSLNGVEAFFRRLADLQMDSRSLHSLQVGALGPAAAEALKDKGILPDCLLKNFTSQGLLREFKTMNLSGKRILLPRADIAGEDLSRGLSRLGAEVDEITVYRTTPAFRGFAQAKDHLLRGEIDIIIFMSSSSVKNLTEVMNEKREALAKPLIVCMGAQTARAVVKAGFRPGIVTRKHTIAGIIEAIEKH